MKSEVLSRFNQKKFILVQANSCDKRNKKSSSSSFFFIRNAAKLPLSLTHHFYKIPIFSVWSVEIQREYDIVKGIVRQS